MKRKVIIAIEAEDGENTFKVNVDFIPKVKGKITSENAAYWAADKLLGNLHSMNLKKEAITNEQ
jgi:hypothetical protein